MYRGHSVLLSHARFVTVYPRLTEASRLLAKVLRVRPLYGRGLRAMGSARPWSLQELQDQWNFLLMESRIRRRLQEQPVTYIEQQTQESQQEGLSPQHSEGTWYEIKEIIAESKTKYRVVWVGEDPTTRQPWEPEWVCVHWLHRTAPDC